MNVLVSGGTGFVGSHLVRRLLDRGHRVTTLDPHPGLNDGDLSAHGATLVRGSVTNPADVERVMRGQEIVFHLASPFGDILQPDSAYWDIEVNGTRNVLASAERYGVRRVVHCSTQGVHGTLADPPGNEDSPIAPRDYYCFAKAEGEKVCREFLERGLDLVIIRPTSVYGPGDTRGWLKLYRLVAKGWFLMIGDGRTYNHPVYVDNLVDCFELAGDAPEAKGRTYIAGDDRAVTLEELVRAVAAAMETNVRIVRFPWYGIAWGTAAVVEAAFKHARTRPPVFRRRLSWFTTNRWFEIERARRELAYEPRVSLPVGLARTAEWYRDNGYLEPAAGAATHDRQRAQNPQRAQQREPRRLDG
jgi:nucleoside-diphosphate-sugar epimerase